VVKNILSLVLLRDFRAAVAQKYGVTAWIEFFCLPIRTGDRTRSIKGGWFPDQANECNVCSVEVVQLLTSNYCSLQTQNSHVGSRAVLVRRNADVAQLLEIRKSGNSDA